MLNKVQNSAQCRSLVQRLQSHPSEIIHLIGLVGSAESLQTVCSFLSQPEKTHLVICPSKEEALFFHTDIENVISEANNSLAADKPSISRIHGMFFPDSFVKCGDYNSEQSQLQILERTELLTDLLKNPYRGRIIVTYPEALIEKVTGKAALQKNILHFKKGDNLDIQFVIEFLESLNFDRTDFVYEPGQFSIRGGIVDIFSYGNDQPYRIELFGNEVENVRTFDPVTQLSLLNIAHVTIIPNTNNLESSSLESYIFDYLSESAIIYLKNGASTMDSLQAIDDKIKQTENIAVRQLVANEPLAMVWQYFDKFQKVEFGSRTCFSPDYTISYHQSPQPSFHKNFDLLLSDLTQHKSSSYENFICSDNPKQIERFYNIFDDIGQKPKLKTLPSNALGNNALQAIKPGLGVQAQRTSAFVPLSIALHQGFIDHDNHILVYTDHQIFERYHRYKQKVGFTKTNAINLKALKELQNGDYVVHIDHGVGKYSGLQKLEMNGVVQEVVRIFYKDNDVLYVNINSLHKISKYSGKEGSEPKINKLGTETWENLKCKTKNKVKDIAKELIELYAKRKKAKGYAFHPDTYLQTELESSFIYEDTPDQVKATVDVKADMEKSIPMDRLVCGDVGFGKTEIAIRAAFKAVTDGKQVALLVPTTILAMQHAKTFAERLKDLPCTIDYINRFKTAKEQKEILQRLQDGKIDIIIGTHMLLGNKIKFKDLGLLVIDEEQKFGVGSKEKLKMLKAAVDTLTLTATPIPRTLQFSMMGARDLSIINTPPPNRQPVTTQVSTFNQALIKEAIEREVYRGGQVYFIHNKVHDIGEMAQLVRSLCPAFEIGVAHGQMAGEELEQRMLGFINREYDVLVCTNIVESGLDIENANTIIINSAQNFGLSDLHQLRGRVGRNNKQAFCYLLAPPMHMLTPEAKRRLQTIEQFSDLGSGFNISLRDLDIRGAGNLLGGEQSGFIAEIGFDMYHKILDEAIRELKENDYKELFEDTTTDTLQPKFVKDCAIDTDTEMLIPDDYINSVSERLAIYRQLDDCENEEHLQNFALQLLDRFGPIPEQVFELFNAVRLRWTATNLGFERVMVKENKMKCYFISDQGNRFFETEKFAGILQFAQDQGARCDIRQTGKNLLLAVKHIQSMQQAKDFLEKMI